jgi:hypothetical protein
MHAINHTCVQVVGMHRALHHMQADMLCNLRTGCGTTYAIAMADTWTMVSPRSNITTLLLLMHGTDHNGGYGNSSWMNYVTASLCHARDTDGATTPLVGVVVSQTGVTCAASNTANGAPTCREIWNLNANGKLSVSDIDIYIYIRPWYTDVVNGVGPW